nr:diacylglycerol kinase [Gammaproteobacteria bacterium]
LLMELVNTALEYVVDRISVEHHPLSGSIKDIGSALVLLSSVFALLVWGVVLWP